MPSNRKMKLQLRSGRPSLQVQEVLVEIVVNELDKHWKKYGEGFQDEDLLLRTLFTRMQNAPDPVHRAVAAEITMTDLEVALQTANRQRAMRTSIAREWVTKSLPLFLNELRQGDIGQFPNKAEFVEHFRDPVYNFDRGVISDKELHDTWTAFYRSNIKDIISLTRQAQERETVLEAAGEILADVVGTAVAGTAISDATNDVLHGAVRLATVFTGLPRWRERARQRALNRDRPSPWLWSEVAYESGAEWDPIGWKP